MPAKMLLRFLALAVLAFPARADDRAHHDKRHLFLIASVAFAASTAFDWKGTADVIHRGGIEKDSWAIGRRPSNLKIVAFASTATSTEIAAFCFTEHSRNRLFR